jgi:hypothetical protein
MSAMQQHQSAMAAVSDRLRISPEVQARSDTIAEQAKRIAELERENAELRAAAHSASKGSARQWQDRCCAQAEVIRQQAKLIDELRAGNG